MGHWLGAGHWLTKATLGCACVLLLSACGSGGGGGGGGAAADTVAPEAPTAVGVVDLSGDEGDSLKITWNASASTDVIGYKIYRGTALGQYDPVPVHLLTAATPGVVPTTFTDTGLTPGQNYYYAVAAFDGTNDSPLSGGASGRPIDNIAPVPASGVIVQDHPADNGGALDISWNPSPSADVVEQRIYRGTANGSYGTTPVAVFADNTTTTFTDTGLVTSTSYFYVVRTFDGTNESANSQPGVGQPVDNVNVRGWSPATPISAVGTTQAAMVSLKTDAAGNITALWQQHDGSEFDVYSADFTGTGWSLPTALSLAVGDASMPKLAVNATGVALSAWLQVDNLGALNLMAAHRPIGGGWATFSGTVANNAAMPHLALSDNNTAILVWLQASGGSLGVFVSHLDLAAGGWSAPMRLDAVAVDAGSPRVVMDANGNAVAQWQQGGSLYTADYDAATNSWSSAGELSIRADGNVLDDHRHGMDANGNIIAVWSQNGPNDRDVYAAVQDGATGFWSTPAPVESGSGDPADIDLAIDGPGNAFVVYTAPGAVGNNVFAMRYNAANAVWEAPFTLAANVGTAANPRISADPQGNAFATWRQEDSAGVASILVRRFDATGGWAAADSRATVAVADPTIVMDRDGNAAAAWIRTDTATTSQTVTAATFR